MKERREQEERGEAALADPAFHAELKRKEEEQRVKNEELLKEIPF
jgi:hypothetical protein